jgi:hypothetical protein
MSLPINVPQEYQAPDNPINRIIQSAMRSPLALDAAPTTAGKQLPRDGDWGFHSNDLYINLNGTVRKFTGTAV